jgi:hypothetical protein
MAQFGQTSRASDCRADTTMFEWRMFVENELRKFSAEYAVWPDVEYALFSNQADLLLFRLTWG